MTVIAKVPSVHVAQIRLMQIPDLFGEACVRLSRAANQPAIDVACLESEEVPRNKVCLHFDTKRHGRILVRHHPRDFEAVNTLLQQTGMKLSGVEVFDRKSE